MPYNHKLRPVAHMLLAAIVLTSCDQDVVEPASIVDADSPTIPRAIYYDRTINWIIARIEPTPQQKQQVISETSADGMKEGPITPPVPIGSNC